MVTGKYFYRISKSYSRKDAEDLLNFHHCRFNRRLRLLCASAPLRRIFHIKTAGTGGTAAHSPVFRQFFTDMIKRNFFSIIG